MTYNDLLAAGYSVRSVDFYPYDTPPAARPGWQAVPNFGGNYWFNPATREIYVLNWIDTGEAIDPFQTLSDLTAPALATVNDGLDALTADPLPSPNSPPPKPQTTMEDDYGYYDFGQATYDTSAQDWIDSQAPVDNSAQDWLDSQTPVDTSAQDWLDSQTPVDTSAQDWIDSQTPVDTSAQDWIDSQTPAGPSQADLLDLVNGDNSGVMSPTQQDINKIYGDTISNNLGAQTGLTPNTSKSNSGSPGGGSSSTSGKPATGAPQTGVAGQRYAIAGGPNAGTYQQNADGSWTQLTGPLAGRSLSNNSMSAIAAAATATAAATVTPPPAPVKKTTPPSTANTLGGSLTALTQALFGVVTPAGTPPGSPVPINKPAVTATRPVVSTPSVGVLGKSTNVVSATQATGLTPSATLALGAGILALKLAFF